jgi:hypothetical protein
LVYLKDEVDYKGFSILPINPVFVAKGMGRT